MATRFEQRNPYKGWPPRPWIRLRFTTAAGTLLEFDLLADTGNPLAIILGHSSMAQLKVADGPDAHSNFGLLEGGWLQLAMPELGLTQPALGYASDAVASAAQASHPDLQGLVGLPILRMVEYGGDGTAFWVRPPP